MMYLSSLAIAQEVARVDLRWPGAELSCFIHPYEGVCLRIVFGVPNAYRDTEEQDQGVNVPVPPLVSVDHFHDWLRWRLGLMAQHEVSEMYWLDGAPMNDPHSKHYWELRA